MVNNFVIWTVQRTGSTSLANIIELLSGRSVYHEPFNRDRILAYKGDRELLTNNINSLKEKPLCFKHCWNVHPEWCNNLILQYVLEQGYSVLFLHRRNMLKVQVSKELAKQTGIWGKKEKVASTVQVQLQPIDIITLTTTLNSYKAEVEQYRNKFHCENFNFLEVVFEDFFDDNYSFEERLDSLKKVCNFLNIKSPAFEEQREKLYEQLIGNKQNTAEDYQKIPNLQAIKAKFPDYQLQ